MRDKNSYILPAFFVLLYFGFKLGRLIKKHKGKKVKKMNDWARMEREAKRMKESYPEGTRLMLLNMNDPYAPVPEGTRGTVRHVDDMGTIHVQWDNGRTLGLVPGEDSFRKLTEAELREESGLSESDEDEIFDENIEETDEGMTQTM